MGASQLYIAGVTDGIKDQSARPWSLIEPGQNTEELPAPVSADIPPISQTQLLLYKDVTL